MVLSLHLKTVSTFWDAGKHLEMETQIRCHLENDQHLWPAHFSTLHIPVFSDPIKMNGIENPDGDRGGVSFRVILRLI